MLDTLGSRSSFKVEHLCVGCPDDSVTSFKDLECQVHVVECPGKRRTHSSYLFVHALAYECARPGNPAALTSNREHPEFTGRVDGGTRSEVVWGRIVGVSCTLNSTIFEQQHRSYHCHIWLLEITGKYVQPLIVGDFRIVIQHEQVLSRGHHRAKVAL